MTPAILFQYFIIVVLASAIGALFGALVVWKWRWVHRREADLWGRFPEEFAWLQDAVRNPCFGTRISDTYMNWQKFIPEPLREGWFALNEETRIVAVVAAQEMVKVNREQMLQKQAANPQKE